MLLFGEIDERRPRCIVMMFFCIKSYNVARLVKKKLPQVYARLP